MSLFVPLLLPDSLGRTNTLQTSSRQGTESLQVLSTTDTDIFPFSFPTHSPMKSDLAAAQLQSPCCGMNCLKTIQTHHWGPFLCFPSHHGQAGHFTQVKSWILLEEQQPYFRMSAHHSDILYRPGSYSLHQCSCWWPTPAPGQAPPHPQGTAKTVKQPRQADKAPLSLTFTIWDYDPLGNVSIPYWKKHHHFKNYLHQAI